MKKERYTCVVSLKCIAAFCFVLFVSNLFAQQPDVKFTHLTNLDGLSQSTVQAIIKDRYGFMWFGTQGGLNRYDGYKFKVYRHVPKDTNSLRRSDIKVLYLHTGNEYEGPVSDYPIARKSPNCTKEAFGWNPHRAKAVVFTLQ